MNAQSKEWDLATRKTRIAFIDAEPLLFESMRALFEKSEVSIVRSMDVDMSRREQLYILFPDIVMLEYKRMDDVKLLLEELAQERMSLPVLFLRAPREVVTGLQALCPHCGILGRDVTPKHFLSAINVLSSGGSFVDPGFSITSVRNADCAQDGNIQGSQEEDGILSDREQSVLYQVALGHYSKEIASNLDVSIKTVDTYKMRAMKKLSLSDRTSVVRYAVANGWFDDLELQ